MSSKRGLGDLLERLAGDQAVGLGILGFEHLQQVGPSLAAGVQPPQQPLRARVPEHLGTAAE